MASNTANLGLLKKNPSTDGDDTFNIQTMLNDNWDKLDANAGTVAQALANVLKPTTPPLIGLPSSTTPDGMFAALANTGELHIWRKTVVTEPEEPAGYTLGTEAYLEVVRSNTSSTSRAPNVEMAYSDSIVVGDDGSITLGTDTLTYVSMYAWDSTSTTYAGKFVKFTGKAYDYGVLLADTSLVYYIPSDSTYYTETSGTYGGAAYFNKAQVVTGYPVTFAKITATYHTSTNPNAYQEADNAKSAGYAMGEVKTGSFKMSELYPNNGCHYKYASSISVADDGTISLDNPSQADFDRYNGGQSYANSCLAAIAGKFVYLANRDSGTTAPDTNPPFDSVPSQVVYIPSDATLTWSESGTEGFLLSKYQPVTGYPAIPAGTTIEYLGKLGDKMRTQVVEYVGTGTYGKNNPNNLTFDFTPLIVIITRKPDANDTAGYIGQLFPAHNTGMYLMPRTNNYVYSDALHVAVSGKTITWYGNMSSSTQLNDSGVRYRVIAMQ